MRWSKQLSAQPNNLTAADARVDQPCNCQKPGKHNRPNDQHLKGGETDAKKIANSPHILRFKISSLQLLAEARRTLQNKQNSRGIPPVSGSGAGCLGNFSGLVKSLSSCSSISRHRQPLIRWALLVVLHLE
ncbi:hypothetical protein [Synechococcus sp. BA-132 BA5]|uniref:hypothetical protein n=1 Tax=Synechococcus sp. BA-132 BA5 TaxID=3110252 RepID=UPI002B1FB8D7|nr:hypothetical protein [Synechococcus sp. BA-132 BA5]MEA5416617.1 hypothetical protein [Synechococcus sp. BA-132 BA5]